MSCTLTNSQSTGLWCAGAVLGQRSPSHDSFPGLGPEPHLCQEGEPMTCGQDQRLTGRRNRLWAVRQKGPQRKGPLREEEKEEDLLGKELLPTRLRPRGIDGKLEKIGKEKTAGPKLCSACGQEYEERGPYIWMK
ncbi:unnamed protein product [Rangifer tarandus platyrhynchus]|uniref:Uncharacterized protein n=1 Tax=Rangifer tarandus platyrhynchus TaxID=3082113 RepID=A0AC59YVW8_RANTA